MCMVPKFIINWFMIMVLLVLKLFVSSDPLELWRCPMHLCFATPWGTSWIPLCYVFLYAWNKQMTFNALLSLLCTCLEYFDLSTQCFTSFWSRLCWCMSPQKLLFCYHLPTRGQARVKLGDAWYVSNVSIIFDAPCLFIYYLLCVLFTLCGVFMHFPELTY
jgi:hypothetical protein